MRGEEPRQPALFSYISLEDRVPKSRMFRESRAPIPLMPMSLNLSQAILFAVSACASLAAASAPVVEWEYSISASEQAQPIDFVSHETVILVDGRVVSFGSIPGSASLAATSAMPGEGAARIHGYGDGLSYGGLVDLALNSGATGVALQATHEDTDGVRTQHLAFWEPAAGFRWVQQMEWSQGLRSVVLTDEAVVTTFGLDSSVDAYSRIDGGLLWGRDMREFGPIGSGRVFVAGGQALSVGSGLRGSQSAIRCLEVAALGRQHRRDRLVDRSAALTRHGLRFDHRDQRRDGRAVHHHPGIGAWGSSNERGHPLARLKFQVQRPTPRVQAWHEHTGGTD